MARSYPEQLDLGAYVSTTEILDPTRIESLDVSSDEFKEFLNTMARVINDINLLVNLKDTGYYNITEFVNGQNYFPDTTLSSTTTANPIYRNVFRKVINFGALPNAAATAVLHGIPVNAPYTFTRMYGCSSNPGTAFVAIPNRDIKLTADATNVYIETFSAYAGYTTTYVILEYIKS